MSGNRSLDEFAPEEPADDEPESAAAGNATAAPAESATDPGEGEDPIEPIAETFAWSAAGGECGVCGDHVPTRWRDGEALVCPDCKAW